MAGPVHSPRRTATRTVLNWNIVPIATLIGMTLLAATSIDPGGGDEGWPGLVIRLLLIVGVPAIAVAIAAGIWFTRLFVDRDSTVGRSAAVGYGTVSALAGWLVVIALVTAVGLVHAHL